MVESCDKAVREDWLADPDLQLFLKECRLSGLRVIVPDSAANAVVIWADNDFPTVYIGWSRVREAWVAWTVPLRLAGHWRRPFPSIEEAIGFVCEVIREGRDPAVS